MYLLKICISVFEDKKRMSILPNKGFGAGGKNTNKFGLKFENETDIEKILLDNGFKKKTIQNSKFGYILFKDYFSNKVIYCKKNGLKSYIKFKHNIDLFREPDECFIIEEDEFSTIFIIEKKEQRVEGSVDSKLWLGPIFKEEYQYILGNKFKIEYIFCLSQFLWNKINSKVKKWDTLKFFFDKYSIFYLNGTNTKIYFENILNIIYPNNDEDNLIIQMDKLEIPDK